MTRPTRSLVAVVGVATMAVIGLSAGPAAAHDPIFVDDTTGADASPRILDGSVSFATYGAIDEPGATAYLRLDLTDGDQLVVGLLVPDQPPENERDDYSHLSLDITDPAGAVTTLTAAAPLGPFEEPFTQTSYLRLIDQTTPAVAGTYLLAVSSEIPTRFTLATGRTEQFGTPVEGYERQPLSALDAWYTTPPPTTSAPVDPPPPTGTEGTAPATTTAEHQDEAEAPSDSSSSGTGLLVAGGIVLALAAGALVVLRRRRTPSRVD